MAMSASCATIVVGVLAVTTACSRSENPGARARPEPPPSTARIASAAAPTASGSVSTVAAPSAVSPSLPASDPAPSELSPLESAEPFVSLDVAGARPAVVSLPIGATRPRPVVVALHGNFDRPEWQCEVWRGVVGARAFILCPRGIPRRDVPASADRWEYASVKAVEQEIDAGLAALAERFGRYVDPGPVLLIGFSLGAIFGSPIAQKHPDRFPRVVLVEGGQARWTRANARNFVEKGGARLFIACGQSVCLNEARRLGPILEKVGLPTRSGGSAKAGHTYDGPVAAAVASELAWLVEGDQRWD